jgi:ribosomal protein L11 methyltransferase
LTAINKQATSNNNKQQVYKSGKQASIMAAFPCCALTRPCAIVVLLLLPLTCPAWTLNAHRCRRQAARSSLARTFAKESVASGRGKTHFQSSLAMSHSLDSSRENHQETVQRAETDGNENTIDNSSLDSPASLRSLTFTRIPRHYQPHLLTDFLLELGATSAYITDSNAATAMETPIFGEPGVATGQWEYSDVTAQVTASMDIDWLVETVSSTLDEWKDLYHTPTESVPNKDWVLHVQKGWKPIRVGPVCLVFPWHTREEIGNDCEYEIELEGGVAFGTGEHPTTQLCLEWLVERVKNDSDIERVLDYGSGSGVLGMAACKVSDKVQAVGVDLDLDACQIANRNAQVNKVTMVNYLPPITLFDGDNQDDASNSLLLRAYHNSLQSAKINNSKTVTVMPDNLQGPIYDIVVANILADPLITLAPVLYQYSRPGGSFGLSGILSHQGSIVVQAYTDAGFVNVKVAQERSGWLLVTGNKPENE